jgi:serine/threonine-protein phosphatase 2B catalytic subunit
MTTFFNFRSECLAKYDLEFYDKVMESFDTIPVGCLVNKRFLAVHGGLSPELETLSDINGINRFSEPPKAGIFCDLLWSDPVEVDSGVTPEKYKANDTRGCSFFFNKEAVNTFLRRNKLLSIIRAHEAQLDGYKLHKWNGPNEFPAVITVFSAPNYCDVYNNKGAVIKFENNTLNI